MGRVCLRLRSRSSEYEHPDAMPGYEVGGAGGGDRAILPGGGVDPGKAPTQMRFRSDNPLQTDDELRQKQDRQRQMQDALQMQIDEKKRLKDLEKVNSEL